MITLRDTCPDDFKKLVVAEVKRDICSDLDIGLLTLEEILDYKLNFLYDQAHLRGSYDRLKGND